MISERSIAVVLDLDNTIYDFSAHFIPPFRKLAIDFAASLSSTIDEPLADAQKVYEAYGSIEYINIFNRWGEMYDLSEQFTKNLTAQFQSTLQAQLQPYREVIHFINACRTSDIELVAYTNAPSVSAYSRLNRLGIADSFSRLIAWDEKGMYATQLEDDIMQYNKIEGVQSEIRRRFRSVHLFGRDERKPNLSVFNEVMNIIAARKLKVFIGDSKKSDLQFCNGDDSISVWAKYGTKMDAENQRLMRQLSPTGHVVSDCILTEPNYVAECPGSLASILQKIMAHPHRFEVGNRHAAVG